MEKKSLTRDFLIFCQKVSSRIIEGRSDKHSGQKSFFFEKRPILTKLSWSRITTYGENALTKKYDDDNDDAFDLGYFLLRSTVFAL